MYNDTEKRKYKRIELEKRKDKKIVTPYIARFRVKQYKEQEKSFPDWSIVAVKNLSAGGMLFNYSKNLETDSLLDLKIDFPKLVPAIINCIGKVIRTEESRSFLLQEGHPQNSIFHIATEFTEIEEQEREVINKKIESILGGKAKEKNYYLEKLEKMKDDLARRVGIAEAKQKEPVTVQTKSNKKKAAEKESSSEKVITGSIGIRKEFLKTKNVCRTTFKLPRAAVPDANSVCIVGDFNNWNIHVNPMKKLKNGDYSIVLDLEPGREYQFRYLIDGSRWENDWNADKYVKNPYGDSDNSVVTVYKKT